MTLDPYRSPGPLARLAPPAPWWRIVWAWYAAMLGVGYLEALPDGGFRQVPASAMRHPPPPFLPLPADPTKVSQ